MDRSQIERFRTALETELKRLDTQREGVLATLGSLYKMEATFFGGALPKRDISKKEAKTAMVKMPLQSGVDQPPLTARARMLNALSKLPEIFQRKDLFEMANSDGNGEINKNTLGGLFSEFAKNEIVKTLGEKSGKKPAQYCRAEDYERLSTKLNPLDLVGFDLFGEGAGPKR